ncbi:MAG: hypothetical protein ISP55_03945 [Flavobacteriales bacterium]|nr:hypothetical protein [Flavobacteriales bacterium]
MGSVELEGAIRTILLDVLEQCARQMDAYPPDRAQFKPIAYAAHSALEDFERKFAQAAKEPTHSQQLYLRAQDMASEWLHNIQELKKDRTLAQELEHLPTWKRSDRQPPLPVAR